MITAVYPCAADSLFYRRVFHVTLLLILICLCYSNTLQQEWHFDDIPNIVESENIHVTGLGFDELSRSFYSSRLPGSLYRPVANLTFALNYLYSGLDTTSYHVVNIAIHVLCAFFAYLVFVRTLCLLGVRENESGGIGRSDIALLGAVLWALHPIQTQAVTYIVQRMASLACLFYLAAMYCYLRFRVTESLPRKILLLLLALVLWLAGVFSKENAALLPLALAVFEVLFYRTSGERVKKYLPVFLVLFIAVSFFSFLALRGPVFEYLEGLYKARPFTMSERLITQPLVLARYLFLLCIPLADFLTLESDIFASTGLFSPPSTFFALVFILALLGAAIFSLKKHPLLRFAILFFFINHLVESSFIGLELYFEHRNYLPSLFLYLAAAYYFCRLLAWYREHHRRFMAGLLTLLLTLVLVSEGNATYLRNEVWETEISLLKDSIEKAPNNMRTYISIAAELTEKGDLDGGLQWLKTAEELYLGQPRRFQRNTAALLYLNKALLVLRKNGFEDPRAQLEAKELLLKSLDYGHHFDSWQIHVNLALIYYREGDLKKAEKAARAALDTCPERSVLKMIILYGRILYAMDRADDAIRVFQKGLAVGRSPELFFNLAGSYLKVGERAKAQRVLSDGSLPRKGIVYHLYRASLFPGEVRNDSLQMIADYLVTEGIDFCSWLQEIRTNRDPAFIYPDIREMESDLAQAYAGILEASVERIKSRVGQVAECTVPGSENFRR